MKKTTISEGKQCPKCGKAENQAKKGYNRSRTQRCMCKECGAWYTINPKKREYPEEIRRQAIRTFYSGASGRGVGRIFGMSKANVYNWIKKNSKK
jgi:transposase-like protein